MLALALLIYLAYRHFGESWLWSAAHRRRRGGLRRDGAPERKPGRDRGRGRAVLMIPFVERSAITGFLLAGLVALVIVALPILVD